MTSTHDLCCVISLSEANAACERVRLQFSASQFMKLLVLCPSAGNIKDCDLIFIAR